jgi:hypothetical protein
MPVKSCTRLNSEHQMKVNEKSQQKVPEDKNVNLRKSNQVKHISDI